MLSEDGFQSQEITVGKDTAISSYLTGLGWFSLIGITSAPLQTAALANDLGDLNVGPFEKIPQSIPKKREK